MMKSAVFESRTCRSCWQPAGRASRDIWLRSLVLGPSPGFVQGACHIEATLACQRQMVPKVALPALVLALVGQLLLILEPQGARIGRPTALVGQLGTLP